MQAYMSDDASTVRLVWSQRGDVSVYNGAWLRQYAYSDGALASKQRQRATTAAQSIASVEYPEVMKSEERVREWLEILNRCVVLGVGLCWWASFVFRT